MVDTERRHCRQEAFILCFPSSEIGFSVLCGTKGGREAWPCYILCVTHFPPRFSDPFGENTSRFFLRTKMRVWVRVEIHLQTFGVEINKKRHPLSRSSQTFRGKQPNRTGTDPSVARPLPKLAYVLEQPGDASTHAKKMFARR